MNISALIMDILNLFLGIQKVMDTNHESFSTHDLLFDNRFHYVNIDIPIPNSDYMYLGQFCRIQEEMGRTHESNSTHSPLLDNDFAMSTCNPRVTIDI